MNLILCFADFQLFLSYCMTGPPTMLGLDVRRETESGSVVGPIRVGINPKVRANTRWAWCARVRASRRCVVSGVFEQWGCFLPSTVCVMWFRSSLAAREMLVFLLHFLLYVSAFDDFYRIGFISLLLNDD
jgi:hypothetical protein